MGELPQKLPSNLRLQEFIKFKDDNLFRKLKEESPIKLSIERSTLLNFVNLFQIFCKELLIIAIKKMQNFR